MEQWTSSILGKEYVKAVYCHPVYLTYMQSNSESESCFTVSNSLQSHGLYSPWNSPGQNTGVGEPFPSPGDLPNPGTKLRFLALQVDSLPVEPQGKPKNTGVGPLLAN